MKSEVYRRAPGAVPGGFTMKHMPEGVFYDEAHAEPLFFTMKHMKFTMKHMARQAVACA
jgi:hypothetical protein